MKKEKRFNTYSKEYVESLKILTPREIEILELVAGGYTNPEISRKFNLSKRTVEKHRENICLKLNLKGYRSLFRWCQDYLPCL